MNAYNYEKCVKWKLGAVEMVGKDCLIAMGSLRTESLLLFALSSLLSGAKALLEGKEELKFRAKKEFRESKEEDVTLNIYAIT